MHSWFSTFEQKTWQRLKTSNILHDAIPHPHERIGHPMHIKVSNFILIYILYSCMYCCYGNYIQIVAVFILIMLKLSLKDSGASFLFVSCHFSSLIWFKNWWLIILKSELGWVQIDEGWLKVIWMSLHFMSTSENISGLQIFGAVCWYHYN